MTHLDRLMARGAEFLGARWAIMAGAMSWVSERHLVSAISNAGGFGVIACGAMTPAQLAFLDCAGTVLAQSTASIASAVRTAAGPSGAELLLLVFPPTLLDPETPEARRANLPTAWASPASLAPRPLPTSTSAHRPADPANVVSAPDRTGPLALADAGRARTGDHARISGGTPRARASGFSGSMRSGNVARTSGRFPE